MTSPFDLVIDVLSWISLGGGAVFCVIGAAGMLRFPDFYTRTHAASITDTLGALLIVQGLALQALKLAWHSDWNILALLVAVKLVMVMGFIFLTSPTAGHALVKAAYASGLKVRTNEDGLHVLHEGEGEDDAD